jgi:hypothetical protein
MSTTKKTLEPNYLVLEFGIRYDHNLVLPYKDGIAVLTALENAKVYKKNYSEPSLIRDVMCDDIKTFQIGAQEYGEAILRNALVGETESK